MSDATDSGPSRVFEVAAGGRLAGTVRVPGDKSVSHRAIIFGALAEGVTEVDGLLEGTDVLRTVAAFQALGVDVARTGPGHYRVQGVGRNGLRAPDGPLDLGNSGTAMRLLMGLLAAQPFASELMGDASLSQRPMGRVMEPLRAMGANISGTPEGRPPITIRPVPELHGIEYDMPVASAQVKSALLLAGLYARGRTCVIEPAPTRDHTERMLMAFGYPVERLRHGVCLTGQGRLSPCDQTVPGDISSAAFFLVGGVIAGGGELVIEHVGVNPTRVGVIEILRRMGAHILLEDNRYVGGEPVADLRVRPSSLRGIEIPEKLVPLAIDEFPAIFVAAACAEGETVLRGAAELRVKECDRIQAMADGLTALGIEAETFPDGIQIRGGRLKHGTVNSHGDHRIAMAFAVAAAAADGPVTIDDCRNVDTSFPGFVELARGVGLEIEVHERR